MTTPFTYLIGWSKLDKWYYGVRWSKNCKPENLWTSYFTSSIYVKEFRKIHGDPDIIEIRKVFENTTDARLWEHKVLKKLKVITNERFLNKSDNLSHCGFIGKHHKPGTFKNRIPWNKGLTSDDARVKLNSAKSAATNKKNGLYDNCGIHLPKLVGDKNHMKNPEHRKRMSELASKRYRVYREDGSWTWGYRLP